MERPELLPSLSDFLIAAGVKPQVLSMAMGDYLEAVREAIGVDYNHYENPYGWLQAEAYRQTIVNFLALLDADDGT